MKKLRQRLDMLETEQEIEQFLFLQQKSVKDLQVIAKQTEKDKAKLIKSLVKQDKVTIDSKSPQLIPLKALINGHPIPKAIDFLKKCRQIIFNGRGNIKEFNIINTQGFIYKTKLKYANCNYQLVQQLIKNNLVFNQKYQESILKDIQQNSEQYIFHLVNKPRNQGDSFIMLHVESK